MTHLSAQLIVTSTGFVDEGAPTRRLALEGSEE
jgi:hypothetical protein